MAGEISPTQSSYSLTNSQITKEGFGSYLSGILPDDTATACGAFAATMQQVRNIRNVPLPKFAQAVINLETMKGLTVNGSSIPTNLNLATQGHGIMALGSGPQNTYTMSDFFGCMSGLPYNREMGICQGLLRDTILSNIYRELYLAVTWSAATVSVTTTGTAVPTFVDGFGVQNYDYYYTISGISLTASGGGYSRGTAPPPIITINGGTGATAVVTNWATTISESNVSTFGRIIGVNLTSGGTNTYYSSGTSAAPPTPPAITASIESPPTITPGIIGTTIPTGYNNTPPATVGWPGMNAVIQNYINQANARIAAIAASNPASAQSLVSNWNHIGTQLKREQRARETAFYPLPDPKNSRQPISLSPTALITFTDMLSYYAQNVKPHMYSQTIEAIANWTTIGGQSMVGSMRQERNATRLLEAGIPLDNNIPVTDDTINQSNDKTLIANGPLTSASSNTSGIFGPTEGIPATLYVGPTTIGASDSVDTSNAPLGNLGLGSESIGYYDSSINRYVLTNPSYSATGDNNYAINATPLDIVDTGNSAVAGSLAGSEYQNLIDPNLNALLSSKQLTPATYTVDEAIIEVEKCNCDCWDQ